MVDPFIAVYWVTKVERIPGAPKPSAMEIWFRMPKFIVGFLAASLVFSFILAPTMGLEMVESQVLDAVTEKCRG